MPRSSPPLFNSLLDQSGVTCNTLPFAVLVNPGIGESAEVLERLALIDAFGVIPPNDDSYILIGKDSHIVIGDQGRTVVRIAQICHELCLVHYCPVIVGIDERG